MLGQKIFASKALQICLIMCAAAFWLANDKYIGIHQDAYLYGIISLVRNLPENFKNDLFFTFGSQSKYSLFPWINDYFIIKIGLKWADLTLTLIGQVAWFAGLMCLIRRLVSGPAWFLCLLGIVFMDRHYCYLGIFYYGESNLTPRIFAEAFCLFSFSALWVERYRLALGLLSCAAVLHPLMAELSAVTSMLVLGLDSRFSLRLKSVAVFFLVVVAGLVLLTIVGTGPLSNSIDQPWLDIMQKLNSTYLLPDAWSFDALCKPLYFVLICGLALYLRIVERAKILCCLLLGMLLLCVVWAVGSGLLRNVFITQLQPWRGLWLMQIIALIFNIKVLLALWQGSVSQRWGAAFMSWGFCNIGFLGQIATPSAALGLALVGCVIWALFNFVPARYVATRSMRLLPLVVVMPQIVSYVLTIVELRIVIVPVLFYVLLRGTSVREVQASTCALFAICLAALVGQDFAPVCTMICFVIWLAVSDSNQQFWTRPIAKIGLFLVLLGLQIFEVQEFVSSIRMEFYESIAPYLPTNLLFWVFLAICVYTAAWRWLQRTWPLPCILWMMPLLGLIALTTALGLWLPSLAQISTYDQPWVQTLQAQIPRTAVVLSDRGVDWSWFALHRSFYESHVQLYGLIFSRQTAIEGYRRRKFLCSIDPDFCRRSTSAVSQSEVRHHLTNDDISRICSDPALDFLILRGRFLHSAKFVRDTSGHENSLIACSRVRSVDRLSSVN